MSFYSYQFENRYITNISFKRMLTAQLYSIRIIYRVNENVEFYIIKSRLQII